MNSSSVQAMPCYSGIYGTCASCDLAGSCICKAHTSGHSDMVTMDRRRFGGIVYVCPTRTRAILSAWAFSLFVACVAGSICLYAFIVHANKAHKRHRWALQERVPRIFALLLASCVSTIVLSAAKLSSESLLIGIDMVPSACQSLQLTLDFFAGGQHTTQLLAGALSTQETTLGRTRINEAVAREARLFTLFGIFSSIIFASPLIGAISVKADLHSETLEKALLLVSDLGSSLVILLILLLMARRTKLMLFSFSRSIAALKASAAIAVGGASIVAEHRRAAAAGADLGQAYRPAYLASVDEEIEQMEAARNKLRTHMTRFFLGAFAAVALSACFGGIPMLWNKNSYSYVAVAIIEKVSYTCEVAVTYFPSKRRLRSNQSLQMSPQQSSFERHAQSV
mmetsp:Transcript_11096/g.21535  ORF Transcript_11096/g.21535 Transcript_11096/m.21535 type:complete len:396 (+) Transcript_11096:373-1560(+)